MDNVIIKTASNNNILEILELLYHLGRPKPKNDYDVSLFKKLITKYFESSDKTILVAELDNQKIVGMVSVIFLPRLNHITLEMYIPELVVLEKYQKHGIGKKMINSCMSLAKERKCHRIRLESGNLRLESHQFYKHLGFEQTAQSFIKNLN